MIESENADRNNNYHSKKGFEIRTGFEYGKNAYQKLRASDDDEETLLFT